MGCSPGLTHCHVFTESSVPPCFTWFGVFLLGDVFLIMVLSGLMGNFLRFFVGFGDS